MGRAIIITLNSTLPVTEGRIILRSGDARAYVNVTGYGTPLEEKNLSQNPVYPVVTMSLLLRGRKMVLLLVRMAIRLSSV